MNRLSSTAVTIPCPTIQRILSSQPTLTIATEGGVKQRFGSVFILPFATSPFFTVVSLDMSCLV